MARREPNLEVSTGRTNGGASHSRMVVGAILILALVAGISIYRGCGQLSALERQNVQVTETLMKVVQRLEQVEKKSSQALDRAQEAEFSALEAARGRDAADSARRRAERDRAEARRQAEAAQQETLAAQEEARAAREEAERIRAERERELNRLHEVLSGIVETRRTALGVVMNLGSDAVEFDFDKATLRPEKPGVAEPDRRCPPDLPGIPGPDPRAHRRHRRQRIQPEALRAGEPTRCGTTWWMPASIPAS